MKIQDRANELFTKYLDGACTPAEWEELQVLVNGIADDDAETLTEPLLRLWEQARKQELPSGAHLLDKTKMYEAIVRDRGDFIGTDARGGAGFIHMDARDGAGFIGLVRRPVVRRIAAAVAACLLLAVGIRYLGRLNGAQPPVQASIPLVNPGINKAVLTLAGGRQVILDSSISGAIGQQGNTTVTNSNGLLAYRSGAAPSAVVFNTVSTGRANQYQIVLPDGSKVWLNAVSSIRFPIAFTGKDRTVEITGECYFEIARNATQPFHVKAGTCDIDVLGTEFNVNAYTDEPFIETALLSGSVRVTGPGGTGLLTPGEQAGLTPQGEFHIAPGNVALAAAWKNGYFQFDKAPLSVVMRQIGRWYDLDIRYEGPVPDRIFKGKLQRSLPLSGILQALQAEDVRFELEGKVLKVMQ